MIEGTDDNRSFSWDDDCTPERMMNWTTGKLLEAQKHSRGTIHGHWAQNELTRRQNLELAELIQNLKQSTDNVHKEVIVLNASSERLERLTKVLKNLTWGLIFLTIALIGIEIWKTYHESQTAPVLKLPEINV